MRILFLMALSLCGTALFAQNVPVIQSQEIIPIRDLRETNSTFKIGETEMTHLLPLELNSLTWDTEGTGYLTYRNFSGFTRKMQVTEIGASSHGKFVYRLWPIMVDRRGDVYTISDSVEEDARAKLAYWLTLPGVLQGLKTALPLGIVAPIATKYMGYPDLNLYWAIPATTLILYVVRAMLDLRKSHVELARPFNFFTRRLARNVERLEYYHKADGELDLRIIYKNGESRGQPALMSLIYLDAKQHQHNSCLPYFKAKGLDNAG